MNIFSFFKKSKIFTKVEKFDTFCPSCKKGINIDESKIFPIQVQLLYKSEFVMGKGYKCPNCGNNLIVG